ncbi:MAG: hypothetical protein IKE55_08955 [Kiritimatiellae bacterium]|nr:hypothetical protein [Kiritimatiellia bacterium]
MKLGSLMTSVACAVALSCGAADSIVGARGDRLYVNVADGQSVTQDKTVNLADGATLDKIGKGEFVLPLESVSVDGFEMNVRDGKVTVSSGATPDDVPTAILDRALFWLKADVNVVEADDGNGGRKVTEWRDCRETKNAAPFDYMHGYMLGQTTTTVEKVTGAAGAALDFKGYGSGLYMGFAGKTDSSCPDTLTRFGDIFIVTDLTRPTCGYGYLFGGLDIVSPFHPGDAGKNMTKNIIQPNLLAHREARWWRNGIEIDAKRTKPIVGLTCFSSKHYESSNAPAMRYLFAYDNAPYNDYARCGGDLVHEVVLFSNATPLTEAEHAEVRRYLEQKWRGAGAAVSSATFRLADGAEVSVDRADATVKVAGGGTVSKASGRNVRLDYSPDGAFNGTVALPKDETGKTYLQMDATVTGVTDGSTLLGDNAYAGVETAVGSGEAGTVEKAGNARAVIDAVPGTTKTLKVSGGQLAIRPATADAEVVAGSTVRATIRNGDFEENIGNRYFGRLNLTPAGGWCWQNTPDHFCTDSYAQIGTNQVRQAGASYFWFHLLDEEPIGNGYLAARGESQLDTDIEITEDGFYDLSLDLRQGRGIRLTVLCGPDLSHLEEIGVFFNFCQSVTETTWYHKSIRTPFLKKGTGKLVLRGQACPELGDANAKVAWFVDNIDMKLISRAAVAHAIPNGNFEKLVVNTTFGTFVAPANRPFSADYQAVGWTFAQPAAVATKSVGLAIRGTGASVNTDNIPYFSRADGSEGDVQLLLGVMGGTAETTFTAPAGKWTLRGLTAPWRMANLGQTVKTAADAARVKATATVGGVATDCGTLTIDGPQAVRDWTSSFVVPAGGAEVTLKLELTSSQCDAVVDDLVLVPANLVANGDFSASLAADNWTADQSRRVSNATDPLNRVRAGRGVINSDGGRDYTWTSDNYDGKTSGGMGYIGDCGSIYQTVTFPSAGRYRLTYHTRGRANGANLLGYSQNVFRSYFAADGKTNVIDEVVAVSTNWMNHVVTFTVAQEGIYSFGFQGLNVPTRCETGNVGCGDGGWDKGGFIAGVSIVKVDSPLAETSLPEDLAVRVAKGAQLRLDFSGTKKVDSVRLGGRSVHGVVSAETYPEYILGEGALECEQKGLSIFVW